MKTKVWAKGAVQRWHLRLGAVVGFVFGFGLRLRARVDGLGVTV